MKYECILKLKQQTQKQLDLTTKANGNCIFLSLVKMTKDNNE